MADKKEIVKQEQTMPVVSAEIEKVLISGDLKALSPTQRIEFYNSLCNSLGLNPLTKPFDYIVLDGKLTLYANKNCAEQLRKTYGVSILDVKINKDNSTIRVLIKGQDKHGRTDVELGVVPLTDRYGKKLVGERLSNAEMKALTKAKRRLTLSLCGLGMLDESEIESIPKDKVAKVKVVDGEIVEEQPIIEEEQPEPEPVSSDEGVTPDTEPDAGTSVMRQLVQRYAPPVCPSCGIDMTLKANRDTGHMFWSCPNYPDCQQTVDYDKGKSKTSLIAVKKAMWELALAQKLNDKDAAMKLLQEYGIKPNNGHTPAEIAEAYNKIVRDFVEDARVVMDMEGNYDE